MKILPAAVVAVIACTPSPTLRHTAVDPVTEELVALERGALDRWGHGDPQGYISIMEPGITFFDPWTPARVDDIDGVKAWFAPFTGRMHIDRYDIQNPRVQRVGDLAVLTFNLVDEVDSPKITARWNTTEVYHRVGNSWRIIHSHWSYVKPELKTPTG